MDADLDTLATAPYARTDDLLKAAPERAPWRPMAGIRPQITDAELVTLAVMQALLGFASEARWLRFAHAHLRHLFPCLPQQPGYNKRVRKLAATMCWLIRILATDTSLWADDVWVVDSTPVECGRSKETVLRSDLAGWAEYGYCASHSRYFWGLRLHLLCTPARPARRLRPDRRQGRRAPSAAGPAGHRPGSGRPAARPDPHRGQELLRPRLRGCPRRRRREPAAPGPPRRARTPRHPVLQAAAPDHRIGQRHLQRGNSTSNATAGTRPPASSPEWCSASWP